MSVFLAIFSHLVLHEGHDAQTKLLSLGRLSVVLAAKSDEGLCKTDESDAECTMIDDRLDAVILSKLLAVKPQSAHEERELLLEGCLLEIETVVELFCCDVEGVGQLVEELVDTVFLVRNAHALDSELHDVDGGE